ncbi:MAG: alpha/beta hydrolase [Bacteroidota bacterium]|nr:alpha/beta hydrolase [Bacteroidota bacterium]
MNLYFISGLGADKRIFQNLVLPDTFKVHYIEWLTVNPEETMASYCMRLSKQIDPDKPFSLLGMSFGGVVAIEMSKIVSPVQTVLISSYCFKYEVPRLYIFIGKMKLYKLLPTRFLLKPNNFVFRLFGAYNPAVKNLLINILQDTDPKFFEWSVNQLFLWNNLWKPKNMLRIHGTADKILPYKTSMGAIPVEGGEHLMVYNKSEVVSDILKKNLMTD